MGEKELGRALLELDSKRLAGVGDVREQTWKILERDRSRVWWWTAATFTMWAVAILMVMAMMVAYGLVFPLQAKLHQISEGPGAAGQEEELIDGLKLDELTPKQRELVQFKGQMLFQMVTVGVTVSVGLTCLAVLCSVMMNRASRRATLRQINASLLEISEQLKELKKGASPPGA